MIETQIWLKRLVSMIVIDIFLALITIPAFFDGGTERANLIGAFAGISLGCLICAVYVHPRLSSPPDSESSLGFGRGSFLVGVGISILTVASIIVGKNIVNFVVWIISISLLISTVYTTIYRLFHYPHKR